MNVKRAAVVVLGLVVLLAGLYQWFSLWRYSAQAQGNVVSLTWVDSDTSVLGMHFTQKAALAGVYFQTPDLTGHQFAFRNTKSGAAGAHPDVPSTAKVPLLYDPKHPDDAMAVVDYNQARTRDWLIALVGLVLVPVGLFLRLPGKKRLQKS